MPTPEPIAVIGLACRFPGAATPDEFWRLLRRGEPAPTPVPASRWQWAAVADEFPPGVPARALTRGHFVEGLEGFDPGFFGMADGEARRLDPQQRLVLEVAWEALESACLRPTELGGSFTGVILGVGHVDHAAKVLADRAGCDGRIGLLAYECIVANRLSHALDLKGPSYAVNAACASSTHAIHAACQSLRAGECDLMLSGGVNVKLLPDETVSCTFAHWASPTGECRSFDARGDGFVCGEGCGVVVLKRLADALRDGDPVWGVLRDTVLGHNGTTSTFSWPSGNAQRDLLRRLLARNGLAPADVDALEAHGTAGAMSDRIEASAFADVLGAGRDAAAPLQVGCLKPLVGHLEAASGVAGLAKMLLALRHESLPRIAGLEALNPAIRPHPGVRFLADDEAWPRRAGRVRRAVVSNFSFGGANGLLLVEEAPAAAQPPARGAPPAHAVRVLPLHARSDGGLAALHERLLDHLDARGAELDDDEVHTLAVHRAPLRRRAVWIARGTADLGAALRDAAFARTTDLSPAALGAERVLALAPATFGMGSAGELARLVAGPLGGALWAEWIAARGAAPTPDALADDASRRRLVGGFWVHALARLGLRPHALLAAEDAAPDAPCAPPVLALPSAAAMPAWSGQAGRPALVIGALPVASLARGDAPALGVDAGAFEDGPDGDLAIAQLLARLHAAGCDIAWQRISQGAKRPVPAAPFDRRPLWFTPAPRRTATRAVADS